MNHGINHATQWEVFAIVTIACLAMDLGLFNRKAHIPTLKQSLAWTAFWVGLAGLFMGYVWYSLGANDALTFLAGYLVEQSLSMDNVFVFIMIFSAFQIRKEYQHKVLFWGIMGAIVMRAGFIFAGISIIAAFQWVFYIFGAVLLWMGIQALQDKTEKLKPEDTLIVRVLKKVLPIDMHYVGPRFWHKKDHKTFFTSLFVTVIVIEFTDLIFALDSVPAVLAISPDPFIVYTSNVFAILGLRSMFFVLSALATQFKYLKYGIASILCFIGIKLLIVQLVHIPIAATLSVIVLAFGVSILASLKK